MVYKTWSADSSREPVCRPSTSTLIHQARARPRQEGDLIALIGQDIERITLENDILAYNLQDRRILMQYHRNARDFDVYIGLPFTKGVTERCTRRTQLILGTPAHHIEAMQNQFTGTLWDENTKRYGDTIRWINAGGLKTGFVGLDYQPQAAVDAGVARCREDVRFLARTLLEFGYSPEKRLFLLDPPYIKESEQGKSLRTAGNHTIADYAR